MQEAHVDVNENNIFAGKYRYQTGYHGAMKFMQSPDTPTAILCGNDVLAIGCIKYLKYNNYNIPEDIAVMGFDGIQLSHIYDPSISTNMIPIEDMGHEAVNLLINKIEKPGSKNRQAIFETNLVIRRSTKKMRRLSSTCDERFQTGSYNFRFRTRYSCCIILVNASSMTSQ